MERAGHDLASDGSEYLAQRLDVADLAAVQAAVDEVTRRWGRLDVIVHNAIYMPLVRFEDISEEDFWRQLHVSIGGLFNCTRAAWELYKKQGGGHIIGIASGSSFRGFFDEVGYVTGKHGVEGFCKTVALEGEPYRIALNTIGPGSRIKPTRLTWEEYDRTPAELKATWADPAWLGQAWAWLASQPPERFSGYRFDAATVVKTIEAEGWDFAFTPNKVTLYPDDFRQRQEWYAKYPRPT